VHAGVRRVKVSADGHGVVSHAGVGMLREVADLTGLSAQVTAALADTYRGPWVHDPGGCSPIWPLRSLTVRRLPSAGAPVRHHGPNPAVQPLGRPMRAQPSGHNPGVQDRGTTQHRTPGACENFLCCYRGGPQLVREGGPRRPPRRHTSAKCFHDNAIECC
jgi:hypothetical protein